MIGLYIKQPDSVTGDTEAFIEQSKGDLRGQVNSLLENRWFILNTYLLRIYINEFVKRLNGIKFFDEEETVEQGYILMMYFDELESMFREEVEYWVIRKRMPVYVAYSEGFIKLGIIYPSLKDRKDFRYRFDNFREATKFIETAHPSATRVNISASPFASEENLVTIFKIKDTEVK